LMQNHRTWGHLELGSTFDAESWNMGPFRAGLDFQCRIIEHGAI